jgi:hypothetical protein
MKFSSGILAPFVPTDQCQLTSKSRSLWSGLFSGSAHGVFSAYSGSTIGRLQLVTNRRLPLFFRRGGQLENHSMLTLLQKRQQEDLSVWKF